MLSVFIVFGPLIEFTSACGSRRTYAGCEKLTKTVFFGTFICKRLVCYH